MEAVERLKEENEGMMKLMMRCEAKPTYASLSQAERYLSMTLTCFGPHMMQRDILIRKMW